MTCEVAAPNMLWQLFGGTASDAQAVVEQQQQPPKHWEPPELCQALSETLEVKVSSEDLRLQLRAMLDLLEMSAPSRARSEEILRCLVAADLPARLLDCLDKLEFETRKDVMRLFGELLRLGEQPVVEYVQNHPRIIQRLLEGCRNAEVALHCNTMLRSCARHPQLSRTLLEARVAEALIDLCRHQSFDVSSDAFSSLRELILTHKVVSAAYLELHFAEFFGRFNALLQDDHYVTQRQALRLLGEMLLDRKFMEVMLAYVSEEQFLMIHMNLLKDTSKAIQFEAFHVFKIYAVNPNKPPRIQRILFRNREKLVKLLSTFQPNRENDECFLQDRKAVIQALKTLEPMVSKAPPAVPPPTVATEPT
eukprot:gnl/TRDRNA2_/TRDRNA2_82318_c0_seq1.p1 gnl/TRDRNA2_/TRDRNA2_82318_c0~~gnl/TRDRNA2_/TRDRNA2_82318_c0_seq1.p1  ORF type:complete len:364 (-),score=85.17 gnl/TRDRNA2_/TRDRNA2_82318_c0_seq1:50-1141(-)